VFPIVRTIILKEIVSRDFTRPFAIHTYFIIRINYPSWIESFLLVVSKEFSLGRCLALAKTLAAAFLSVRAFGLTPQTSSVAGRDMRRTNLSDSHPETKANID
jgi:hypothetical protein